VPDRIVEPYSRVPAALAVAALVVLIGIAIFNAVNIQQSQDTINVVAAQRKAQLDDVLQRLDRIESRLDVPAKGPGDRR
jgi:hypothetical protein